MSFDVKTRLSRLKSSAKERGIAINLDVNKYQNLIDQGCHFCGSDLKRENGYCLDRVDSNLGYIISNLVPCCKICNRAKSDMNVYDFINWLQTASEHMKKQLEVVKELQSLNIDQEFIIKLEEELHKELNKNKEKLRIKYVP